MQLTKFRFTPEVVIVFTADEIAALFKASMAHYDMKCNEASLIGGVLWNIRNRFEGNNTKVEVTLRWCDVDLLGKIAEQLYLVCGDEPVLVARLNFGEHSFSGILRKLNDEYTRVNRDLKKEQQMKKYAVTFYDAGRPCLTLEANDFVTTACFITFRRNVEGVLTDYAVLATPAVLSVLEQPA